MDREIILAALREAVATEPSAEVTTAECRDTLGQVLSTQPALQALDGKMIASAKGGWSRITLTDLAHWMSRRVQQDASAEDVVHSLELFLQLENVNGFEILPLVGINVDRTLHLANDIDLVPYKELPQYIQNDEVFWKDAADIVRAAPLVAYQVLSTMVPRAALIRKISWPLKIEVAPGRQPNKQDSTLLKDISLCLSLVPACAPLPVAELYRAEEWVPFANHLGATTEHAYDVYSDAGNQLRGNDVDLAIEMAELYSRLNDDTRRKLRLPLSRLGSAKRRFSSNDRALELTLGLEALLLTDGGSVQVSLAFRLRGAWLLGNNEDERAELYDFFEKLYNIRSAIVHGRRQADEVKLSNGEKVPLSRFLRTDIELCSEGIQKVIRLGRTPKWTDLLLGRGA